MPAARGSRGRAEEGPNPDEHRRRTTDQYVPESAFEAAMLDGLADLRRGMLRNSADIDHLKRFAAQQTTFNARIHPAVDWYEGLVPLAVDKLLPQMLIEANRSAVVKVLLSTGGRAFVGATGAVVGLDAAWTIAKALYSWLRSTGHG